MFVDRREAGERLAEALLGFASEDPVVLGLPRGGVPVAAEVASALHAPLDVLVVRKLGCPWQPELGFGAIGEGGVRVVNAPLIEMLNISQEQLDQIVAREESEVARRVHRYRGGSTTRRNRGPDHAESRVVGSHHNSWWQTQRPAAPLLRQPSPSRLRDPSGEGCPGLSSQLDPAKRRHPEPCVPTVDHHIGHDGG